MRSRRLLAVLLLVAVGIAVAVFVRGSDPEALVLTGVVTTENVVLSSQIAGRIESLSVDSGDAVGTGDLVAVIAPGELAAESRFYAHSAEALAAQEAAAEADIAAAEAQVIEEKASLAKARQTFERNEAVAAAGGIASETVDESRTAVELAEARVDAASRRVAAAQSALASVRRQREAAMAQAAKADVRLGYSEVHAPVSGIVDVRAARLGEVVTPGQPIVTLIDPEDLWVRVDVEESYVERTRIGDTLVVRLPSGEEREGTIFYRGVDADFATQRDVSRTKRDIKTFELRLRVDNSDRRLAVGMTAYVLLPVPDATT